MIPLNDDEFNPNHPRLFHGTAGEVEGGVLKPTDNNAAWATDDLKEAERYAVRGATTGLGQQRLFGTVYEVEPSENTKKRSEIDPSYYSNTEGLKVGKAVSFPPTYNNTAKSQIVDHPSNTKYQSAMTEDIKPPKMADLPDISKLSPRG